MELDLSNNLQKELKEFQVTVLLEVEDMITKKMILLAIRMQDYLQVPYNNTSGTIISQWT